MTARRRPTLVTALLFAVAAAGPLLAENPAPRANPAPTNAPQSAEPHPLAPQFPEAQEIFTLTNQDRSQQGLQPLHWDVALAAAAQAHAEKIAATRSLSHQLPSESDLPTRAAQAGAHFAAVAENIAVGYSPAAIERKWMDSTPHRTNILDSRMNAIGIGIVEPNHDYYAVEDFAESAPQLSFSAVEDQVKQLLRQQGIHPDLP
jgi:uncharacterized protein YkwD